MIFKKAKQNRIFQDIVEQIQEAILAGKLAPGDKLPAERTLCDTFKTSRGTLREALRILEQKKLITITLGAGGGSIVRELNGELMAENFSLLLEGQQTTITQLVDMTARLLSILAALAAARAGKADIEPLKQLVLTLSELLEEATPDREILLQMEALLFTELGRIADNRAYVFLIQALLQCITRDLPQLKTVSEARIKEFFQEIRMVVYAVAKNDRKKASILCGQHIQRWLNPQAAAARP